MTISRERIPEFVALISDELKSRGKPSIPSDVQSEMVAAYTEHGVPSSLGGRPLNEWARRAAVCPS